MQTRVSLWCSAVDLGWSLPPREPLNKAEFSQEDRVHTTMLESRRYATEEDLQQIVRSMRVIVGMKDNTFAV